MNAATPCLRSSQTSAPQSLVRRFARTPFALGLVALGTLASWSSAQDRFAPVAKDYVPFQEGVLSPALLGDFDGNGALDVLSGPTLFTNSSGRFVRWPAPLPGLGVGLGAYDFDGDGKSDVLHGDSRYATSSSIRVSLSRLPSAFVFGSLPPLSFGSLDSSAAADFDGDGDLDIVMFPYSFAAYPVQLQNDSLGNFTDVSSVRMPAVHVDAVAALPMDVDLDGDMDLLLSRSGNNPLAWMENLGQGLLAAPTTTRLPAGYTYVFGTLDVDGDGRLDLIANNFTVLLSQPTGFVVGPSPFPLQLAGPTQVLTADFDGDADVDVWFESYYGGGYFENLGSGVFADRRNPPIWRPASVAAVTDVDGDGKLDILAVTQGIEIFLGQPGGQFWDLTRQPLVGACYGDFDGDGLTDHLATAIGNTRFRKSLGTGDFVESVAVLSAITSYQATVDLDGDDDLDVVGTEGVQFSLGLYFNNGSGSFTVTYPSAPPQPTVRNAVWVVPGDLDGDGDTDLVVHFAPPTGARQLQQFENLGGGSFVLKPQWSIPALQGIVAKGALLDADYDGDLDLVVSGNDPALYANDGTGHMTLVPGAFPPLFPTTGRRPTKLLVGDVNGDGRQDLIAGYLDSTVSAAADAAVYLGNGLGGFTVGTLFTEATGWNSLYLADADDDGDLDMLVALRDNLGYRVQVRSNNGLGAFTIAQSGFRGFTRLDQSEVPSTVADIDDDGDIDVVPATMLAVAFNQTRHLRVVTQPRLGGSFALEIANPELQLPRVAAVLVSTNRLATPLRGLGTGLVIVDPAPGVLFLASGAAPIPVTLPLPNNLAFLGLNLFAQAGLLSSTPLAFTNAVREQVIQ